MITKSLPFVFLLIGVVGLVALVKLREAPPSADNVELVPLVTTIPAKRHENGFNIRVDGEVIPYREINLAAEVRGKIARKTDAARAGNFVREGELLFEIEKKDYELQVKQAQAALNQKSASIEENDVEKSNLNSQIELDKEALASQAAGPRPRIEESAQAKGSRQQTDLEAARRAEIQLKNVLQGRENQLASNVARRARLLLEKDNAAVSLEIANLNLERTTIKAPTEGIVTQDTAEEDDYVQVGAPLCRMEDTASVEVRFNLRLEQLRWLWNSTGESPGVASNNRFQLPKIPIKVVVDIDGYEFYWKATLDRYDGAGLGRARTAPVIAVVDDPSAVNVESAAVTDRSTLPAPPTLLRGTFRIRRDSGWQGREPR